MKIFVLQKISRKPSFSTRKHFCVHDFLDFVLHILISQTADQGVQRGDHHCVKHRGHFACVPGVLGVGNTVEEQDGAIKDADGRQVGGTSGESLAAPAG